MKRLSIPTGWPEPRYSAAEAAEFTGTPKRTLTEIARRLGVGDASTNRMMLTVAELKQVLAARRNQSGQKSEK